MPTPPTKEVAEKKTNQDKHPWITNTVNSKKIEGRQHSLYDDHMEALMAQLLTSEEGSCQGHQHIQNLSLSQFTSRHRFSLFLSHQTLRA